MEAGHIRQRYSAQTNWTAAYARLRAESEEQEAQLKLCQRDAKAPANRAKNRYRDVLPYDKSRVRLDRPDDYINASLVPLPEANRRYILCQGPLRDTAGDFWRMCWEQGTRVVCMLNRLVEKNTEKCYRYWPAEADTPLNFPPLFQVELLKEEVEEHFTTRTLQLTKTQDVAEGEEDSREIVQFQFTTWPDFGVPEECSQLLQYLEKVRGSGLLNSQAHGAAVVHCSAGIGRSGTFIIVDSALNLMSREVDINELALELRKHRMGLIQTWEQLRFTWKAVVTALEEPCWAGLLAPETGSDPPTPPVLERGLGNQLASGAASLSVDSSDLDPSTPTVGGARGLRKRTFTGSATAEELSSPSPIKCASAAGLVTAAAPSPSSAPPTSSAASDARERRERSRAEMAARLSRLQARMAASDARMRQSPARRWLSDYGHWLAAAAAAGVVFLLASRMAA